MDDTNLEFLRVCIDKELAADQLIEAAERAIAENPENDPRGSLFQLAGLNASRVFHPVRMALITGKKWAPGRTLKVALLGGTSSQHDIIAQSVKAIEQHANIKFSFGGGSAEIRVAFYGDGAWSYLGTDILGIPAGRPTMNLDPRWALEAETILHEFCHSLACIHEHQNPRGGIQWNKPVVYEDYRQHQGWSREEVDQQLFARYSTDITQYTALDPLSIMMYPIQARHTLNGFSTPGGRVLTATDKSFLSKMYPGAGPVDPPPPPTGDWKKKVTQARDLLSSLLAPAASEENGIERSSILGSI